MASIILDLKRVFFKPLPPTGPGTPKKPRRNRVKVGVSRLVLGSRTRFKCKVMSTPLRFHLASFVVTLKTHRSICVHTAVFIQFSRRR